MDTREQKRFALSPSLEPDFFYRPQEPTGEFDTIVCTLVLNALSRNNRTKAIEKIRGMLTADGIAYLGVARNVPVTGKMGVHHSLQNCVVLTLPSVYADEKLEIYALGKIVLIAG